MNNETRIRSKGEGAHYSKEMKRLSLTHLQILKTLSEHGSRTKAELTGLLNLKAGSERKPLWGGLQSLGACPSFAVSV
jgi:hypothetical protein